MALNDEQARVVEFISRGHNCLITGHAGSGKSRVVNSIIQYCYGKNLKVGVVCSSGIACKVYAKGLASTVHAYYGLGIADLPSKQVIERATRNSLVVERIRDVDVIIWDEASMSSARMLELVNCLHHELTRTECGKFYPFGGKQIVLVGEFLQLRPVPGKFDDGRFMFLSNVFEFAIPHRIQLNQIMRQSAGEERFIEALQQLRLGLCSQETSKFLTDLSRDLPSELRREATHIFFKNSPAILHNRSIVDDLPGEIIRLHATFEGHSKHMKWPGQETLLLKNGCKVMLVWNKSATLKNGSVGTFEGMTSNGMAKVNFDSEGTVLINKDSWLNRDVQGQVIGSVSQYPLVVAYAVTSHKSQALTVPAVVVHCTNEFVPGLTYVAASRVRSADHLQMLNFQPRQLLKPPPSVVEQCSTWIADPKPDLSCCRNKRVTDDQFFEVTERQSQREFDGEEIQFPMEQIDNLVSSYFEVPGQVVPVELSVVYNQLARHVSELAKPPRDLIDSSMHAMLQALKKKDPQTQLAKSRNEMVDFMLSENKKEDVLTFINIIWYYSFQFMESHLLENDDEVVVKMTSDKFTKVTAKLHQLFGSDIYPELLSGLFNETTLSYVHKSLASQFSISIHLMFMKHLMDVVQKDTDEEPVTINVEEMSPCGKAKVRHVGGWAVRKLLEKSRKYVQANMFTESSSTLASVLKHNRMCELIEEALVIPYSKLEEDSQFPESLQVTENLQYRGRGLIHITDAAYQFFLCLEQQRVLLLNEAKLKERKEEMVEMACKELLVNGTMKEKWTECFNTNVVFTYSIEVEQLYKDVIHRYVNMGAAQYLRDFRRENNIKKSVELRKRVMQRQEKRKEKSDSVPFQEILEDQSDGKHKSHGRLASFIDKHEVEGLVRVYLKAQLVSLCRAYEVNFNARSTKPVLAVLLTQAVRLNRQIPHPSSVDNRQYTVEHVRAEGEGQGIVMRFRIQRR